MNLETALASVAQMIYAKTGKHLSNLQTIILKKVWRGKKYLAIIEKRSEFNNILGDLYWISGQAHQAIAYQEATIVAAIQCLNNLSESEVNQYRIYYLKMLKVDSLLSLELY
ncbi:MAG: hypothetical protein Kow0049_20970 [Stanieria sp.]